MTVAEQVAPPTINYREFDPECDLWVTTEATPMLVRYALSNNIGLGGHNAAVIFKRWGRTLTGATIAPTNVPRRLRLS